MACGFCVRYHSKDHPQRLGWAEADLLLAYSCANAWAALIWALLGERRGFGGVAGDALSIAALSASDQTMPGIDTNLGTPLLLRIQGLLSCTYKYVP